MRADVTRVDNKALFLNYHVQETARHTNERLAPRGIEPRVCASVRQGKTVPCVAFVPKRAVHASEAERVHCKARCAPFSAVLRVWAGTLGVISAGVRGAHAQIVRLRAEIVSCEDLTDPGSPVHLGQDPTRAPLATEVMGVGMWQNHEPPSPEQRAGRGGICVALANTRSMRLQRRVA